MMTISFPCRRCGQLNQVESVWAGHTVQCGACDADIVVPTPRTAPRPQAVAAPAASRQSPVMAPLPLSILDDDEYGVAQEAPPPRVATPQRTATRRSSPRSHADDYPPRPGARTRPPRSRPRRYQGDLVGSLVLCAMGVVALGALGSWGLSFLADPPLEKFSPTGGNFSILLPGTPVERPQSVSTPAGRVTFHQFDVGLRNGVYMVSYADLPPGIASFDSEGGARGIAGAYHGSVFDRRSVVMGGYVGVEVAFRISDPNLSGLGTARVCMVGNRLYACCVVGTEARSRAAINEKFFNSFTVTGSTPAPIMMMPVAGMPAPPIAGPPQQYSPGKAGEIERANDLSKQARAEVAAGRIPEGVALFEEAARLSPEHGPHYLMEAAKAWLRAGEKAKALEEARKSDATPLEVNNDLLLHYWHRGLGDVYLATGEPRLAIPHFEQAIARTDIEGYRKDCEKSLAEARALVPADAAPATP